MKKEFALAFNEVLDDKQLPKEVVLEALESAMVSAYRKTVNASTAQQVAAKLDLETGDVHVFAEKEVVEDVQDERTEVLLEEARKYDPNAQLGDVVMVDSTPADFGRVAAQTARQVIQQRIREAERDSQFEHFNKMAGEVVNGIVQAVNPGGITLGLDRKAEGLMPRNQQLRGERFRVHDRVRALLMEVKQSPRGPQIILSRAHRNFLRRLLEDEVPEIFQGLVEIRSIAREPGYRSKVAVAALQPGIDPVGACVGVRGVRIQAIVRELNDEKIDVIEWNPDPAQYIAKALSPARVTGVYLDEDAETKTATVVVPEDQLSLAIGRDGQNARLAAKLTGWRIDIKSLAEAAGDSIRKLRADSQYETEAAELAETIPLVEAILAKKAEGRPVTPEEYTTLGKFVNRIEVGAVDRRQAEMDAQRALEAELRKDLPVSAFDIPLDDLGLSPRLTIALTGEGYSTIGDLMVQMRLDKDRILGINGVGPKAIESIEAAVAGFNFPVVEPPAVQEMPQVPAVSEPVAEAAVEAVAAEPAATGTDETALAVKKPEMDEEERIESEEKQALSIDEAFALAADMLAAEKAAASTGEAAEGEGKKKKKKKYREIEYDPDLDVTIVKKLHKRGEEGWEEE